MTEKERTRLMEPTAKKNKNKKNIEGVCLIPKRNGKEVKPPVTKKKKKKKGQNEGRRKSDRKKIKGKNTIQQEKRVEMELGGWEEKEERKTE